MQGDSFDVQYTEALAADFKGWDFSFLNERLQEESLPWEYRALVEAKVPEVRCLLDMGTGGGEFLASIRELPPIVWATEAYEPNIRAAVERLGPLGIAVADVHDDVSLPFPNGTFDLVMNRHASYEVYELRRISQPGAYFLTQQVGAGNMVELNRQFDDTSRDHPKTWCLEAAESELKEAGFEIRYSQEAYPKAVFLDIGSVVYYLRAIPWQIPGLSLKDKYVVQTLRRMHRCMERRGGFVCHQHRFVIAAQHPV